MRLRLIDGNALLRKFTHSPTGDRFYTRDCDNFPIQVNLEAVQREIRKAPTIDAVQVIRCKDCKFGLSSTHEGYLLCSAFVNKNYVVPNGFCSEAEIKD